MEVNTDQIDEKDGVASCQVDQNQLQSMKVSLDPRCHNNCYNAKRRKHN